MAHKRSANKATITLDDITASDLSVGTALIGPGNLITEVNAAGRRLLAMPGSGDFSPYALADMIPADDALGLVNAIEAVATGASETRSGEYRFHLGTGDLHWMSVSMARPAAAAPGMRCVIMQFQSIQTQMEAYDTLRLTEHRWRFALESALQGVWDHDLKRDERYYSPMWKTMRGLAAEDEVDGDLDDWIASVHPDDRAHALESVQKHEAGDVTYDTFQYREKHADGRWVWIESRGSCIEWGADGKPTRVIGTDIDITDRKWAEAQLVELSRRLKLVVDVSNIGVFDANLDTGVTIWDERLREIYWDDSTRQIIDSTDFEMMIHPDDRDRAVARISEAIENQTSFNNAFRIVRQDGAIRHIRASGALYRNADGELKMIGANWDVTADVTLQEQLAQARVHAEERAADLEVARSRIEYNALHDHLTDLPNRRYLDQMMNNATDGFSAVLHIDLDRFKQINDKFGHQAGDRILVHTATVLRTLADASDFVARIGGDEFLILCGVGKTDADCAALAGKIIEALSAPVDYKGHICRIGASIGIARHAGRHFGEADLDQPLLNADVALYRAKSMGRNRYEFFSEEVEQQLRHARRTADDILDGLEKRQFVPFYQLQFCARSLAIVGVETLVRWNHPEKGLLTPDAFLKIADEIDALQAIDRHVLEQASRDFRGWQRDDLGIPRFSVNVSSRRLRDGGLMESLDSLDIEPGTLSFELLESIFLDDLEDDVADRIAALKTRGIDIEIDDFGTGHASIIGLLKLSPTRLKIDRALVKPICAMADQRRLVESIIDIGHSLNIEVVAEGVETMEHARILRDIGCDTLQGYALARPMARDHVELAVRSATWRYSDMVQNETSPQPF